LQRCKAFFVAGETLEASTIQVFGDPDGPPKKSVVAA
jgi:hypothetical protein